MLISNELGIKYPIFCGAMARITDSNFAAIVSNAGALGVIAIGDMNSSEVKEEVIKIKKLTTKPYAVNVMLQNPYCDEIVEMLIEENVPIIIFGAGMPFKYMEKLNKTNIKVFVLVSSTSIIKRLEKYKPFGYIVEGMESGGHIGKESTLPLIQAVKKAFPDVRIIAAGGFATGESLNAALMLGASGIQLGTRFLASKEAPVSDLYKEEIIKAKDNKTVITGEKFGMPVRILRNEFANNYKDIESKANDRLDLEIIAVGSLKKAINGDIINGSLMCGEIASVIDEIKTVKEILEDIIKEAKESSIDYLNLLNEIKKI